MHSSFAGSRTLKPYSKPLDEMDLKAIKVWNRISTESKPSDLRSSSTLGEPVRETGGRRGGARSSMDQHGRGYGDRVG